MPTATKTKASDQSRNVTEAIRNAAELLESVDVALLAEARDDAPLGLLDLVSSLGWDEARLAGERLRARRVGKAQENAGTKMSRENLRKRIADGEAAHAAERDRIGMFLEANPINVQCRGCMKQTGALTIASVIVPEGSDLRDLRYKLSVAEGAVEYLQEPVCLPEQVKMRLRDEIRLQTASTNSRALLDAESRLAVIESITALRPFDFESVPGDRDLDRAILYLQNVERSTGKRVLINGKRVLTEKEHGHRNKDNIATGHIVVDVGIVEPEWASYMGQLNEEASKLATRIEELRAKVGKNREVIEKLKRHYVR